jgi:hypothetical protein
MDSVQKKRMRVREGRDGENSANSHKSGELFNLLGLDNSREGDVPILLLYAKSPSALFISLLNERNLKEIGRKVIYEEQLLHTSGLWPRYASVRCMHPAF